jgi:thiamine kinase-like enzyme
MSAFFHDSKINALIARMPTLSNVTCISLLGGGLTNKNYLIDTETGSYVMRVSDGKPHILGINREHERINTHLAHEAGVGPAVIDSLVKEGILLIRWIDAETLHAKDMQNNPELLERIAESLRMLHSGAPFRGDFHFPSLRKKYLRTIIKNNYFIPEQYIETEPLIAALEDAVAVNPEPPVPCNNDLLAENFLDDGNKIWIIDYEYSGQNEASFEIGNLAAESELSENDVTLLCKAYWQRDLPAKVARACAWSMIARFGWVAWASIQEAVSNIDFDFRTWGLKKWNSVLPELKNDNYYTILDTLKQEHS